MPFLEPKMVRAGAGLRTFVASTLGAVILASVANAQRAESKGVFTDRTGGQHPWSVTSSHALIWDQQTYVPVGGNFAPRYLAEGQTEDNWAKDSQALATLKTRGVMDVIVDPVISAADVPAAAWQRLLDHLDANGF